MHRGQFNKTFTSVTILLGSEKQWLHKILRPPLIFNFMGLAIPLWLSTGKSLEKAFVILMVNKSECTYSPIKYVANIWRR